MLLDSRFSVGPEKRLLMIRGKVGLGIWVSILLGSKQCLRLIELSL